MGEFSREFLEETWRLAKKTLPGWVYATLLSQAKARAGGRAAHRVDEPNALGEIRPSVLRGMSDDELSAVWSRVNQWFVNARKRKQPVEDIVHAAFWAMLEMEKRKAKVEPNDLTAAIERLRETSKARVYQNRMKQLPMLPSTRYLNAASSSSLSQP